MVVGSMDQTKIINEIEFEDLFFWVILLIIFDHI